MNDSRSFIPAVQSVNGQRGAVNIGRTGRWITSYHGGVVVTSQAFTAGRVLLAMFDLPVDRTIDGIAYVVGATSNGNVRVGIMGPVTLTADTPVGAEVVVQSASVAQAAANSAQLVALTPTPVVAGLYYAALQSDSGTGTYMRHSNQGQAPGLGAFYDRAGGYGAFVSPVPSVTETGTALPGLRIRLA